MDSGNRQLLSDAQRTMALSEELHGLPPPEAAERLTVELARRAGTDKSTSTAELPKIEGRVLPQKPN